MLQTDIKHLGVANWPWGKTNLMLKIDLWMQPGRAEADF